MKLYISIETDTGYKPELRVALDVPDSFTVTSGLIDRAQRGVAMLLLDCERAAKGESTLTAEAYYRNSKVLTEKQ